MPPGLLPVLRKLKTSSRLASSGTQSNNTPARTDTSCRLVAFIDLLASSVQSRRW